MRVGLRTPPEPETDGLTPGPQGSTGTPERAAARPHREVRSTRMPPCNKALSRLSLDVSAFLDCATPPPQGLTPRPSPKEAALHFQGGGPGGCGEEYVELVLCPFRPVRAQKGTVP